MMVISLRQVLQVLTFQDDSVMWLMSGLKCVREGLIGGKISYDHKLRDYYNG